MQFIGAKGMTLFVAIFLIACGAVFGAGLLVGRQFPVHNFQKFGESRFVLDPTTGKVCDPFKDPNAPPSSVVPDLSDLFGTKPAPPAGFQIVKPASDFPPACGK